MSSSDSNKSFIEWGLGILGSFLLITSLPRLFRLSVFSILPRMAGSIVTIVLSGLMLDKVFKIVSRNRNES